MDYIYPERGHDYDWFDETVDENVPTEIVEMTNRIATELRAELLPEIATFRGFEVGFMTSDSFASSDWMAKYSDGTVSHPYIALNYESIKKVCEEQAVPFYIGIETSITHELGHAVQEAMGLKTGGARAERQAEEFAKHWYEDRDLDGDPLMEARLRLEQSRSAQSLRI